MDHADHISLIKKGISQSDSVWADLGSGEGAFTLALRDVLGPSGTMYSVDQSEKRLAIQKENFERKYPQSQITYLHQNFTKPLPLPPLDGILMANSIHYIQNKKPFLINLKSYLKTTGKIIIVEYNVDQGNYWVPYPISFPSVSNLFPDVGFSKPKLIGTFPSLFLEEIYSVQSYVFM